MERSKGVTYRAEHRRRRLNLHPTVIFVLKRRLSADIPFWMKSPIFDQHTEGSHESLCAEWDKAVAFFAKGNEWSYRELAKCVESSNQQDGILLTTRALGTRRRCEHHPPPGTRGSVRQKNWRAGEKRMTKRHPRCRSERPCLPESRRHARPFCRAARAFDRAAACPADRGRTDEPRRGLNHPELCRSLRARRAG